MQKIITKFLIIITLISTASKFTFAQEDRNALPRRQQNLKIQFYKVWKENDFRTDEFQEQIQPNKIRETMHFRVLRDRQNKIVSVAYYFKNLKIAPYVNEDKIWFHYIKYYYNRKNLLTKKTFYRDTGEPQAQYVYEYNDKNQIIKVELQVYDLNPYRENEYLKGYFVLFDYFPNGKVRIMGRFDKNTNPQEKYIYDNQGRLLRYERFYGNSKRLHYYITFTYGGQNRVKIRKVYNIDGVLVEVPTTQERRRYEDLLRTRYPRPGRRRAENVNNREREDNNTGNTNTNQEQGNNPGQGNNQNTPNRNSYNSGNNSRNNTNVRIGRADLRTVKPYRLPPPTIVYSAR